MYWILDSLKVPAAPNSGCFILPHFKLKACSVRGGVLALAVVADGVPPAAM